MLVTDHCKSKESLGVNALPKAVSEALCAQTPHDTFQTTGLNSNDIFGPQQ